MACKWIGLDLYNSKLDALSRDCAEHMHRALYQGANVVANAIKEVLTDLPTRPNFPIPNVEEDGLIDKLTDDQKNGIIAGFGVTKHELVNGSVNTHIGVNGYNHTKTKHFPNGQPNALVLRSYNSGSSVMKAHHIIDRVTNATRQACIDAMQAELDQIVKEGDL